VAFHEINRFKVKTLPLAPFLSRDGETRTNIPSSRNGSKWKTKVKPFQKRANLTRAEVSEFIERMRKTERVVQQADGQSPVCGGFRGFGLQSGSGQGAPGGPRRSRGVKRVVKRRKKGVKRVVKRVVKGG